MSSAVSVVIYIGVCATYTTLCQQSTPAPAIYANVRPSEKVSSDEGTLVPTCNKSLGSEERISSADCMRVYIINIY
jgi:hypothetical protein